MDSHFRGLASAGLIAGVAIGTAGSALAQDKEGYKWASRAPSPMGAGPIEFTDTAEYKKDLPYVIGFSNASVSNIWRVGMAHAIEAAAARATRIRSTS